MRTERGYGCWIWAVGLAVVSAGLAQDWPYVIVDTGQRICYGLRGEAIPAPAEGQTLYGQDAQYQGLQPAYRRNGDGTVTDLNTGLIWQRTPPKEPMTWQEAKQYADGLDLGGRDDWRLPTIKELLSIADFSGSMQTRTPYVDTKYFDYHYPDTSTGVRDIDAQYWSSNGYLGTVMRGQQGAFGFNFADGRSQLPPGPPPGEAARSRPRLPGRPPQPGDGGPRGGSFVSHLDRDGDGRVARDEFDGPAWDFPSLDLNHDGFLSEDEAPHRHGRRPPPGRDMR